MLRTDLEYKTRLLRIKKALRGVGVEGPFHDFKAAELTGKIQVDGLEELMLATWSMINHLSDYLQSINCGIKLSHKITDLTVSIEQLMEYVDPEDMNKHFVVHEIEAMENVSRAAYKWMKLWRMLKDQEKPGDFSSVWWE